MTTTEEQDFARLTDCYLAARRSKRYGREQMAYEADWVRLTMQGMRQRRERTFRADHNYAFLTPTPKWREIFATDMAGRIADHELCDRIGPYVERELHPRTFNNRPGMGQLAAINRLLDDLAEVEAETGQEPWVVKVDIRGFFPSARWDVAFQLLQGVIRKHVEDEDERGYLEWLAMILIHANPAAHCERRTPRHLWHEHINPAKSLFTKPEGVGAAIGRLVWQTAMGLYVSDDVRWLNDECGLRTVCFVDDMAMAVPADRKDYALGLLPELRRRLAGKGLALNERKFYCQPFGHGVEFLGFHVKPHRLHLNDATYRRALGRVSTEADARRALPVINSYAGLLGWATSGRRLRQLGEAVEKTWGGRRLAWNPVRQCAQTTENKNQNPTPHANSKIHTGHQG